jgi:hypothetical protein
MLLHEKIAQTLGGVNGMRSPIPQTVGWSVDGGPVVEVDFTAVDSLSCAFRELRVAADELKTAPIDALKVWADRLCQRVTYLLEHLGPLEADREAEMVLVRSTPPAKTAESTTFYEVLVKAPGIVSLRRYTRETADAGRAPVDMQMTHEVLLKLVRDIVEAMPAIATA